MKRRALLIALAVCVWIAPAASAQSDLGFKRLGGALSYVSPEDLDGTIGFGVFADLGTITPQIGLEAHIDYWSQSEEAFGVEASISDLNFGARGKYYFPMEKSTIRPFAGAGLGLHFLSAEVTIEQPGFPTMSADDSETKLGLDLGGGIVAPLGARTDLHGEMWYGFVSDVSQLNLRMGLSFKLGS